jgi:hypothetical protein
MEQRLVDSLVGITADPFGFVRSLLVHRRTGELAARNEAHGRRPVGFVIGRLPDGWHVWHDIPVRDPGANIDHVVVGPAGTFTIDTKSLTGKVWVGPASIRHNGHPTDFLRRSRGGSSRASRLLGAAVGRPVDVRGVVAILADDWTIAGTPDDVQVASPRGVRDWLLRLPVTLTPHEIVEIAVAASTPSTWVGSRPRS